MLEWVLDKPYCDVTRLVHADWLQEQGEDAFAAFVRDTPVSFMDCFELRMRILLPCMEAIGEDCTESPVRKTRKGFGTRSCHRYSIEWTWHMGYPSEIRIPKFAFMVVGRRLVQHWPLRKVTFTDLGSDRSKLRRNSTWKGYDLSEVYWRELVPDPIFALYAGPYATDADMDLDEISTCALQWARGVDKRS